MSYRSERTGGILNLAIDQDSLTVFCKALTGSDADASDANIFSDNNKITLNSKNYLLKNTQEANLYNLCDVVAAAVDAGYEYTAIDNALKEAYVQTRAAYNLIKTDETHDVTPLTTTGHLKKLGLDANHSVVYVDEYKKFLTTYDNIVGSADVLTEHKSPSQYINSRTFPGLAAIADRLNGDNPNTKAYIETRLDPKGNGVTYTHTLHYINPAESDPDKAKCAIVIDTNALGLNADGTIPQANLNNWYRTNHLDEFANAQATLDSNTKAEIDTSNAVLEQLNNISTNNAVTNKTWSQAELDAIRGETPTTDSLAVYNKAKDHNVLDSISGSFKTGVNEQTDLVQRASLKELQGIADTLNKENQDIAQRDIDSQTAQLLTQIRRDPELYRSIMSQLRSDAAAGTIAGQRAANIGAQTHETAAAYDKSAADLYSKLFAGQDGSVADSIRSNAFKNKTTELDDYINSMLSNASARVAAEERVANDYITQINNLKTALGVDTQTFENLIKEATAKAEKTAAKKATDALDDVEKAVSDSQNSLEYLAKLFGVSEDTIKDAVANNTDVSNAVSTINTAIREGVPKSSYTKLDLPEFEKSKKEDNAEYDSVLNNEALWSFIANPKKWTTDQTIQEFAKANGFDLTSEGGPDLLTEEGMKALFKGYAEEANKESNQIFNAAQRAYIAAVTAGDSKTTDQLTKLASSVGGAKGNLYAASALANQYQQQTNAFNTGRQLATDYQNQQSANLNNIAQSGQLAHETLNKTLGSATDYNTNTLYGLYNQSNDTKSKLRQELGGYADAKMSAASTIDKYKSQFDVDTFNALSDLMLSTQSANRYGAQGNNANTVTKKALEAQAQSNLQKNNAIRKQNNLTEYTLRQVNPNK